MGPRTIDLNVDVHHLTRVEGHGNIQVCVKGGKLESARWQVVETPRYFEAIFRGKHYSSAPILAARVCGICSIAHTLASLEATERAFGVTISPRAAKLRLLAKHGETLQSHWLHLFFLAAPDFLNVPDAIALIPDKPEVVALAARLKGVANRLCDLIAGRTTHPVTLQVGGVSAAPRLDALRAIRDELEASVADVKVATEVFSSLKMPEFQRETEFVSLGAGSEGGQYPFIGQRVISTDGVRESADEYLALTNEYIVEGSTSKYCKLSRDEFAVGPLARLNNNFSLLHEQARAVADRIGLRPVCSNPFYGHFARVVECVHATFEAMELIDALIADGSSEPAMVAFESKAGVGVGAVEAPRGILYHRYEYDDGGRIVSADCVIPTTQNHGNIQADLEAMVPQLASTINDDAALERLCSMLVRAYDPCISCSVH